MCRRRRRGRKWIRVSNDGAPAAHACVDRAVLRPDLLIVGLTGALPVFKADFVRLTVPEAKPVLTPAPPRLAPLRIIWNTYCTETFAKQYATVPAGEM